MKRYFKYGLIILMSLLAFGWLFYLIKKPKVSVLNNIPKDVQFCFTIDKSEYLSESSSISDFQNDSIYQRFKTNVPIKIHSLILAIGINPLGDMAFFGKDSCINLAWIGNNKESMEDSIQKNQWVKLTHKNYKEVKLSNDLYLYYNWPLILLRNKPIGKDESFFNKKTDHLNKTDLYHTKTKGCLIYGFVNSNCLFWKHLKLIPHAGKMFVGFKSKKGNIEAFFVQPELKLHGKLGLPSIKPHSHAVICWPFEYQNVKDYNYFPDTVKNHLDLLLSKPISYLQAEILDTFSRSERIITYDMDAEFKLTQKITFVYKSFPGMQISFVKTSSDKEFFKPHFVSTDLGLDVLKLNWIEYDDRYIFTTDTASVANQSLLKNNNAFPSYYLYANLNTLKTDPFWKPYLQTNFNTISLFAENIEKGSVFILNISKE